MEIRHGILFIRLNGRLNKTTSLKIDNYIIPILNKNKIKFIAYNLKELNSIDKFGLKSINNSLDIIYKNNGIAYVCDINDDIVKECVDINALIVSNELNVMECLQI